MDNKKISVVIPTLGGKNLNDTIAKLNQGTLVPDEILLSIPEGIDIECQVQKSSNIRIIISEQKGQVPQRALGFKYAINNLVLQIDDDIQVEQKCLETLTLHILKNQNTAVGPMLYDLKTHKYNSYLAPKNSHLTWYDRIIFLIINGFDLYKSGVISKSGLCMGVADTEEELKSVEWLPGGCILHWKKNLITNDFYKEKGKAFAEDLHHSKLLNKNGIILKRSNIAIAFVNFNNEHRSDILLNIKLYALYSKRMNQFSKKYFYSRIRLNIFLFLNAVRLLFNSLLIKN